MPAAAGRLSWRVIAALALLAGAGECSSSAPTPKPNESLARYSTAGPLLTQCAITHSVSALRSSAEQYNATQPKNQRWLFGNRVELTNTDASAFTDWFQNGGGAVVVGGQTIGAWPRWADNHRQLPARVCGTAVTGGAIRHLYAQVYAHWPASLRNDPW